MLIFTLLLSLAISSEPVENYYLKSSTMHGGTPMSGTSHGKAYYFAIHETVTFPNLMLNDSVLTLQNEDTLIYSVIKHSGGEQSEKTDLKSTFDVRFYQDKYYVSTNAKDDWENGLLYRKKRQIKTNAPTLRTVPDETSTGYAP